MRSVILKQRFDREILSHYKTEGHRFNRAEAFKTIGYHLIYLSRPVNIIETGSLRTAEDWIGNGQSTLVWNWLIRELGGKCVSIDLSPSVCDFAKSHTKHVEVINGNSLSVLPKMTDIEDYDIIYLDSFDWSPSVSARSSLHHVTELGLVWDRLKTGCLIAVDDCHEREAGKHALVKYFFDLMGNRPIHEGWVTIWKKG